MRCGHLLATKDNKQWLWLAVDVETREIVGVYVGDGVGMAHKDYGMH